jgi:TMEM175 potassium channel family protein
VSTEPAKPDAADVETGIGETKTEYDLDRTIGFSDGVMAIAITLMVLDLEVPSLDDPSPTALFDALWTQRTQIFVYALSFVVLARYWLTHHRLFGQLERVNTRLTALNLLFLALIGLVPFPTDVLGRFASEPIAVSLYAVEMALVTATLQALYQYSVRADLVRDKVKPPRILQSLAVPLIFLSAVPFAFLVSAPLAPFLWFAIGFVPDDEHWGKE